MAKLNIALKARRDANAPETDPGLINNACDLAGIELETNKPAEALALLDPIAKKLADRHPVAALNAAYSRVARRASSGPTSPPARSTWPSPT